MVNKRVSISDLVKQFFLDHKGEELQHGPVVDWVEEQYKKLYRRKPRDTWRAIRKLHEEGFLEKVRKGVYRYNGDRAKNRKLQTFPNAIKKKIFRRDGYRCVVCGKGKEHGVEIHADHIVPLDMGGSNTADNGQTLCSQHNLLKKNYSQTEFGKKLMIKLYKAAKNKRDERMVKFCEEIFDVYDKYGINGHIQRPNGN